MAIHQNEERGPETQPAGRGTEPLTEQPMTYTLDGVTHREHFVEENGDYIARIEGAKTFATSQPPIDAYLKTFAELRQA